MEDNWKTYNWLYEYYHVKKLSYKQISKIVGKSDVYVCTVARELGIKTRSKGEEKGKHLDHITKSVLEDLYINKGFTTTKIADILQTDSSTIICRLAKFGIVRRDRALSKRINLNRRDNVVPFDEWANEEWLFNKYITQKLSINQIVKEVGWGYGTVRGQLIRFKIPLRNNSDAVGLMKEDMSRRAKKQWESDDFRAKMAQVFANRPKVSSIQLTLYSLLDDLGIKYYREYNDRPDDKECTIGPYNFDCVVPRNGDKTLLIECQGSYYHSAAARIRNDQRKASYIVNNLSHLYDLRYIWEHEFNVRFKVINTLKYWLGIYKDDIIGFDFSDITIKACKVAEYKTLLSKYHYLPTAGRPGSTAYGAYIGNILVAVCTFSPLPRQNISIDGFEWSEVRELSRLCIHPSYQKKNFGSWLVSRCIKLLPKQYKCIIAYSDITYNHTGSIYKATNFKVDKIVDPDYWYINDDGWVMHKKTLYNQARSACMKESEFARISGYSKVHGFEKIRFKFIR